MARARPAHPGPRAGRDHPLGRAAKRARARGAALRPRRCSNPGVPVLGICYGMQLMTALLGGQVEAAPSREYGPAAVQSGRAARGAVRRPSRRRWTCGPATATSWRRRRPGFRVAATSANAPVAAMEDAARRLLRRAVSPRGGPLRRKGPRCCGASRTACAAAGATGDIGAYADEAVARIRAQVGGGPRHLRVQRRRGFDRRGAADPPGDRRSADVRLRGQRRAAARRGRAGDAPPRREVPAAGGDRRRLGAVPVGARGRDRSRAEAEDHRRACSSRCSTRRPSRLGGLRLPGAGHALPGRHRVGRPSSGRRRRSRATTTSAACPGRCGCKLVEPLRQLFKDEVRQLGRALGLDEEFVARQPFPGPGLAVRIVGEVTRERLDLLRRADAVVVDEIRRHGLVRPAVAELRRAAAGAQRRRDGRRADLRRHHRHPRGREPRRHDGRLGAAAARPAGDDVDAAGERGRGINRVVYDISSKPPSTIEWE